MTTPDSPYHPPSSALDGPVSHGHSEQEVPNSVLEPLLQTRPWVKLVSIFIFIATALGLLVGFFAIVTGKGMLGRAETSVAPICQRELRQRRIEV